MNTDSAVIVSADIHEYFQREVEAALTQQAVRVEETTAMYLVNLLAAHINARELFEQSEEGLNIKPLALHYADALNAASMSEKRLALRRLGDVALFISGLFAGSLNRKIVDIDYYIAMGGTAYSCVHDLVGTRASDKHDLFAELAENFAQLVDVLGVISDSSNLNSNADVLRLYEIWLRTGSTRASEKLRRHGIQVSANASSRAMH
ncbi:MAG: hypothetical protein ACU85U_10960 [Gammaproteobacteria bacterium]|jgi:hypothetical protein